MIVGAESVGIRLDEGKLSLHAIIKRVRYLPTIRNIFSEYQNLLASVTEEHECKVFVHLDISLLQQKSDDGLLLVAFALLFCNQCFRNWAMHCNLIANLSAYLLCSNLLSSF